MKDYDAYLFDWDGNLAKTLEVWLELKREVYLEQGVDLTDDQIVLTFGRPREVLPDFGATEAAIEKIMNRMHELSAVRVPLADFYPGAREVLESLKNKRKKLAIITSSHRRTIQNILDGHQLHGMFDVVITSSDVTELKPHPEGILTGLEALGVDKSKALMLGDSDKDLGAAKNAGIDSLLFYPPSHELFYDLDDLRACQPTYVITSWQEMLDQLQ